MIIPHTVSVSLFEKVSLPELGGKDDNFKRIYVSLQLCEAMAAKIQAYYFQFGTFCLFFLLVL